MIKLFQNILAYRLTDTSVIHGQTHDQLNDALSAKPARHPASQELNTIGFVSPYGEEDSYIEKVDRLRDTYILAVMSHERLIPGKVVRTEVSRRVSKIEASEGRKVYAREKQRLKDDVITEFMPRAFVDHKITYVLISGPYIFIDSSSAKRGEDVLATLRDALGSLPVRPVAVKGTPIDTFTRWVTNEAPQVFSLTGDFKANGLSDESDLLTGKGVDLNDPELHEALVTSGRRITQLGLSWCAPSSETQSYFTINEMLGLKGIKWDEDMSVTVAAEVGETEDDEDRRILELRASAMLRAITIRELWIDLLTELGGEDVPNGRDQSNEPDEEDLV